MDKSCLDKCEAGRILHGGCGTRARRCVTDGSSIEWFDTELGPDNVYAWAKEQADKFVDQRQQRYEEQQLARSVSALKRRAATLDFVVTPVVAGA